MRSFIKNFTVFNTNLLIRYRYHRNHYHYHSGCFYHQSSSLLLRYFQQLISACSSKLQQIHIQEQDICKCSKDKKLRCKRFTRQVKRFTCTFTRNVQVVRTYRKQVTRKISFKCSCLEIVDVYMFNWIFCETKLPIILVLII